jgi:MraZ protein
MMHDVSEGVRFPKSPSFVGGEVGTNAGLFRMVFTGRFDHVIDDKGRLAIPSIMRNQIRPELHGEGFYLVQDKRYLQLVPERLFEHLAGTNVAALLPAAKVSKASRFFFASVMKLDPDKQGRVMIPDGFMKDSKNPDPLARMRLSHDVTLVGNGDRIEIWNRADFLSHMTEAGDDTASFQDDITERFGKPMPVPQLSAAGVSGAGRGDEGGETSHTASRE